MAGKRTRDTERKLLVELLKNSKKSDRELARILGVSQPTVSRMRVKLETKKLIRQYTVVPDLVEMGFELLAISTFRTSESKEIGARSIQWTNARPNVLFAARVDGMGKNGIMISVHKDYTDYANFIREVKKEGEGIIADSDSLLISLKGFIAKPFSPKYLAELIERGL